MLWLLNNETTFKKVLVSIRYTLGQHLHQEWHTSHTSLPGLQAPSEVNLLTALSSVFSTSHTTNWSFQRYLFTAEEISCLLAAPFSSSMIAVCSKNYKREM